MRWLGQSCWTIARDGGVFSFGDARATGRPATSRWLSRCLGMAADPVTGRYWLVAGDGGVFTFGEVRS